MTLAAMLLGFVLSNLVTIFFQVKCSHWRDGVGVSRTHKRLCQNPPIILASERCQREPETAFLWLKKVTG